METNLVVFYYIYNFDVEFIYPIFDNNFFVSEIIHTFNANLKIGGTSG